MRTLLVALAFCLLGACTASRTRQASPTRGTDPGRCVSEPVDPLVQTYQTAYLVCHSDPAFASSLYQQVVDGADPDSDLATRASGRLEALRAAKGSAEAQRACDQAARWAHPSERVAVRAPEEERSFEDQPPAAAAPGASGSAAAEEAELPASFSGSASSTSFAPEVSSPGVCSAPSTGVDGAYPVPPAPSCAAGSARVQLSSCSAAARSARFEPNVAASSSCGSARSSFVEVAGMPLEVRATQVDAEDPLSAPQLVDSPAWAPPAAAGSPASRSSEPLSEPPLVAAAEVQPDPLPVSADEPRPEPLSRPLLAPAPRARFVIAPRAVIAGPGPLGLLLGAFFGGAPPGAPHRAIPVVGPRPHAARSLR